MRIISIPTSSTLLLSLLRLTSAQQGSILSQGDLPACATQCPLLISAQQLCLPPAAPQGSQGSYNQCFCNSNYLTQLRQGQQYGTCDGICTAAEMTAVLSWFQGTICSGNAAAAAPNTQTQAAVATTVVTSTRPGGQVVTTTRSQAQSASATSNINSLRVSNGDGRSWISTHYQWIIMVIVLLLAAGLAIWFGVWFKRRHRRNVKHSNDPVVRTSMLVTQEAAASLRNKHDFTPQPQHPPGTAMSSNPTGPSALSSSPSIRSGAMSPGAFTRNPPRRNASQSSQTGYVPTGAAAMAAASAMSSMPNRSASSASDLNRRYSGPRRNFSTSSSDLRPLPRTYSSSGHLVDGGASMGSGFGTPVDERPSTAPLEYAMGRRPSASGRLQKMGSTGSRTMSPLPGSNVEPRPGTASGAAPGNGTGVTGGP